MIIMMKIILKVTRILNNSYSYIVEIYMFDFLLIHRGKKNTKICNGATQIKNQNLISNKRGR